jgi:ribosomal protein L7/L12
MTPEQHQELTNKVKGLALEMAKLLDEEGKIPQIRIIREIFGCGLKQSFDLQETLSWLRRYAELEEDRISPGQP